jgi:peroxiredoxin Q/BCP
METDDSNLPEIELDHSRMEAPQPKKALPTQRIAAQKIADPEPKIELDWNVPHGQMAAKHRDGFGGSRPVRVSGAVQHVPQAKTGGEEKSEVGKHAPTFRAVTFDGKLIDLAALRGKKVWLTFYRYATCPLCNLHISEISRRYPDLKKAGVEVVSVFDSRVPEFFQPGGIADIRFPMISDSDKKLYHLYGTRSSIWGVLRFSVLIQFIKALTRGFRQGAILGDSGQLPSSFLIDSNGVICDIRHGKTAVDYMPWLKVEVFAGLRGA